jgi:transposase
MALVVGIDLGRKSEHDALIFRRETGRQVGRGFRFPTTCAGMDKLFRRVEQVREPDELIEFVIDSPGRAWVPIAAAIKNRGFLVFRPTTALMKSVRRGASRRNKTNPIDAKALCKCLMNHPEEVSQVFLPSGRTAKLDQLVRQRDRLVDSIRRRKQRVQDFCEAINPGLIPAMGDFALSQAGRAFLRRYLDPRKALRSGLKRITRFLERHYRLPLEKDLVNAIYQACQEAVAFYEPIRAQNQMPFDEVLLQQEMEGELDRLECEEQEVLQLEQQIRHHQRQLDPQGALISLPGISHILAAGIRSCIGNIDRFDSVTKHRGFAGFYSSANSTGDTSKRGGSISKMSSSRYKRYIYLAADNAYKWDLELAAFYHNRRQAGHTHRQAVCAVANGKLIPRIHHILKAIAATEDTFRAAPHYVFRDLSGNPISKREAKAIIQAKWGGVKY